MKKWFLFVSALICLFVLLGMTTLSYADSAEVLPKGVWKANIATNIWFPIDRRFDPDGDTEDIAVDYNTTLDGDIFPALAALETAFGLPTGSANIGDSIVSFEYRFTDLEFDLQYGITDKLTVGIHIPYWFQKNEVDSALDTTNATVGLNPFFGSPGDPFMGSPLAPLALGGVPLTTEQTKDLLSQGLDVNGDGVVDIPGFGYKRFKTWSDDGVSDIEAGLRYQYYKSEKWRLAFTGGVRLPTGEVDDTDDLVDLQFGSGAWALLFHLNNDYTGIKNVILNATFRYELYLPDEEKLRIPEDVNIPITRNKERIDRNYGDVLELEVSAKYELMKGLSASLLYEYGHKFEDDVDGDLGFSYESLEDETDWTSHIFIVGLSYTTLPLYMEKKFPLPMEASLSYRNRFAGDNNVLKSEYIKFALGFYF
jgi:hypothetical protein